MKISVYTIGCKVNQYESDSLIKSLIDRGYDVTSELIACDVYIINTCAVTNEAERKSRQCVARARKLNQSAKIYIIGCAAERNSEQFRTKEGVIYISGTANKSRLSLFDKLEGINVETLPSIYEDDLSPLSQRTRSYIKVQDGCNNFCSYCILPYVRGRSRSRSVERIIEECKEISIVSNEIVLTGINLSAYGLDIGSSLVELIKNLKGINRRLRLGSLEVNIINEELLQLLITMPEFCQQFHLSLQSGDDKVLRDMNRHYTREEYYDKVALIRRYFPDAAITTDIIVGYPTEEENNFNNTLELVERVKFANIHLFPYSRREGTVSEKLTCLNGEIINNRMGKLDKVKNRLKEEYEIQFIGKPMEVLIEEEIDGEYQGYSKNYIKIFTEKPSKVKDIMKITPLSKYKDGLKG